VASLLMASSWESTAPAYEKFVAEQRRLGQLPEPPHALADGQVTDPIHVDPDKATELMRVAALRAAGLYRPTTRTVIVWIDGDRELAIVVAELRLELHDGLIVMTVPCRCDQVGSADVTLFFAVGSEGQPAGLYASTERRPRGPQLVIDVWGDNLVAFGWQCLLGLVSGLAGAVGKDGRGNLLIPVQLEANSDGITIFPMARHRFSGYSGLTTATKIITGTIPGTTGTKLP
jgi:hypothetical protein